MPGLLPLFNKALQSIRHSQSSYSSAQSKPKPKKFHHVQNALPRPTPPASIPANTNTSTAATSFRHLPFSIPESALHHVNLLLKPHQEADFKEWMKEMEIYAEILVGAPMSILLVVLVGWSIRCAIGRWRERVRDRDRERVEEGRRISSEEERRRCLETVGILRRYTGDGTPSPRTSAEGCVAKRVRFLEVEPDEEVVMPRRPEHRDAVVMVGDSVERDMGEVL